MYCYFGCYSVASIGASVYCFGCHNVATIAACRCYSVASVPWYQKKIASVVFATPPYSTYAEVGMGLGREDTI